MKSKEILNAISDSFLEDVAKILNVSYSVFKYGNKNFVSISPSQRSQLERLVVDTNYQRKRWQYVYGGKCQINLHWCQDVLKNTFGIRI